ncbi:Reverse transcriptase zinc-binding domain [Arabidopsis thaliana x Arabidopsis arenosa]|uniref:Reverse transcriptase zinc-binding domain n=1 Tax=Arabidopsis thaliana x Arabidopsis arenosa TaxID=1240361 RepID=A0A8T2A5F2_9BRAS|nr:Reverse transcriptase zinc-binding domain [Arabidopsis thaliana x Arabidopsis arenosa]
MSVASDSWNWRCLLRLRDLAESFVKCNIGNGRAASFWFDNWTPFGPLIKFVGTDGPRALRIPINAKVSDACNSVGWILPSPRSDHVMRLHVYLTNINRPTDDKGTDSYEWMVENKICDGFSARRTWSVLRPRANLVDWSSSVWFKGATPRHAFNMWTANLDRLPTKSRLAAWGVQINTTCGLCSLLPETRDHLLLTCDYALYFIWNAVSSRLHLPQIVFGSWSDLISWTRVLNVRSPPTLRKIIAQAVIYAIWKQRNNLHHNQIYVLPSVIFKDIDRVIKNSITARRLNKRFRLLMSLWLH